MKIKALMVAVGLAGAVFSLPAAAQMSKMMSSVYLGAEVGQADQKFNCSEFGATTCDGKDTAYRLFLGYQFHRIFSVEGGYTSLGSGKVGDATGSADVETTLLDLSVIGAIPVGPVSLFGRLGGYHSESKAEDVSHDKNGWLIGAGVGFDINKNIGLRAEWKRYLKTGGGEFGQNWDADMISIGGLWRFQ
jgi:OmpA-OmpF porin, OOP family